MKKILLLIAAASLVTIYSCKNKDAKNKTPESNTQVLADSLYKQVLGEHDKGMSGWMKIEGKQLQLDSLIRNNSSNSALKDANEHLSAAYKAMDEWMTNMNLDSATDNLDVRIKYLSSELQKGSEITTMINNSLSRADSLLKAVHQ